MDNELILRLFSSKDKNYRNFGFKYLISRGNKYPEIIKIWLNSINEFGYRPGDVDVRDLFVFFNFSNKHVRENFIELLSFYHTLGDSEYKKDFFFLIYMSSIDIQKVYIKDLKMFLSKEEYQIIEGNFKEYENFKGYKLDELFLALINLLNDTEELNFMDLDHRLIETIIDLIIKFPAGEVSAFIENIISEKIESYYLNSYLFYINAHLTGFINADDVMNMLINRFKVIKYAIIEQSFFVRPIKDIAFSLIEKDFGYIGLLKYFSDDEIMTFYTELKEKYKDKELFIEYFTKLFSVIFLRDGIKIAKIWLEKKLLVNREAVKLLNSSCKILNL